MKTEEWMEPRFRPASTKGWRGYWFRVIFRHHEPDERRFDVILLGVILVSVITALLDSVALLHAQYGKIFYAIEWVFTIAFTLEYFLRLSLVRRPMRYVLSFYGLIDLMAALPTYISLFVVGADHLLVIRVLRILRVFRILEMVEYSNEGSELIRALYASRRKIGMFVLFVLLITVVFGAVMYLVEGPEHGFSSIPHAMYWAIVTMATVGFGDITPQTPLGQFITSIMILIGYGIIAVPTGIFGAQLVQAGIQRRAEGAAVATIAETGVACARCGEEHHYAGARFCQRCGERLGEGET
ncbi:MAG TPA: ion transporter [Dokdonella sp.]|uniref:ion transporter n=1 Tax=Dokdonella sp. TaxID=2291710 RepID=UPI002D80EBE0|nr:ion transporter [Dokdonella sp.]HET9031836.1 ion transporter [Dokdonella sp.]